MSVKKFMNKKVKKCEFYGHLTILNWMGYKKYKSIEWNLEHMPKCMYCNCTYGSPDWNDDLNIKKNVTRMNRPIEATKNGKRVYICPSCYLKNCPVRYK